MGRISPGQVVARPQAALPAPLAPPARGTSQRGFSLVESLAAGAILAGVMISVMTMFVYGGQHVNSGKLMTKAISIASDTQEQFRKFSHRQAYEVLRDNGNPAQDTAYRWYSLPGTGPDYPQDPAYRAVLDDWKNQVEKGLPGGQMRITVRGLGGLGTNPPEADFNTARVMQVVVSVQWRERKRDRSVVFETLKL